MEQEIGGGAGWDLFPMEPLMAFPGQACLLRPPLYSEWTDLDFLLFFSFLSCCLPTVFFSFPWGFDYSLNNGEADRDFQKICFYDAAPSLFLFPHRCGKHLPASVEERWVGLWT